jgi:ubiquinone/menaquinone biosynthesis C-methylase UbiE
MLKLKTILKSNYPIKSGIVRCLSTKSTSPQSGYDRLHKQESHKITDGSYEILAQFAKGGPTLDLACGDGYLVSLSPDTTVGVDFSLAALKKAKKLHAKFLVHADAHSLPFQNKSFELCICTGSLEHFENPAKVLSEIKRVSRFQIIITHRPYPIPFASQIRLFLLKIRNIPNQPIDSPMTIHQLIKLYEKTDLKIVYKGVWTQPFNLEMISSHLPRFLYFPSCTFIISHS